MKIDEEKLNNLQIQIKEDYDAIGVIRCPFFGEDIRFTSEGFQHLLFKGATKLKKRDKPTQWMRLKLFKLTPKLLRQTKTVQEYHLQKQFITVKHHKRKEKILKNVEYWGFIAIIDARKIKVVIKQVGNGDKKFWSIIPNWRTRSSGEVLTHTGSLESD